ncbi:unnamed protein product [Adineta steineri]|uniref:Transmembrane protein n=1 Tax=Adineta steineri TaxID=433720 RepID=A0A815KMH6_9BILA|nr:unnamed protein product [Adineta steineri]CAF3606882.1 unnamed protein product [Adineta steineri]
MDTNIRNNEEQQQLIPMYPLSKEKNSKDDDDNIITLCETNGNTEKHMTTETKQPILILRIYTWLVKNLRSIHLPHLSDKNLRIVFLIFIILIGLTSFTIALIVGSSIVQFKQQCPLYASFKFQTFVNSHANWTIKIIPLTEKFSSQSTCDFCTFYNVFTFIYCIMTGFFFILFNGDHSIVTTNDQCLIIPWFPISIILGFFSLINASILTNGFLKFCTTMTSNDNHINTCTQLNNLYFEQYPNVSSFFMYMLVAIISSWFQLAFFIGIITILTIRLGSSFDRSNNDDNKLNGKPNNNLLQSMEQT